MSNIWFISDPHFGHQNIIKYENRPYANIDEMDAALITNWNSVVKKEDQVFVLGDISFYNKEKTSGIVSALNGSKMLILGNHDANHSVGWFKDVGFDEVSKYPIIYREFFILSHQPLYINDHMPYANIHGHTHGKCYDHKQYYNVSVENIGYTPISLQSILEYYGVDEDHA